MGRLLEGSESLFKPLWVALVAHPLSVNFFGSFAFAVQSGRSESIPGVSIRCKRKLIGTGLGRT